MVSFPSIDWDRLDRLEQNFTDFAATLKDLETARLPGRLAILEGACLEERLALLESYNTAGVARICRVDDELMFLMFGHGLPLVNPTDMFIWDNSRFRALLVPLVPQLIT